MNKKKASTLRDKRKLEESGLEVVGARLKIDAYYVREFFFSVRGNLDETARLAVGTGLHVQARDVMTVPDPSVRVELEAGSHSKDVAKQRVILQVASGDEDGSPYIFKVTIVGYFSVRGDKPSEEEALEHYRNAATILYSTAREIVASATARGPFPAYLLPTLAFIVDSEKKLIGTAKSVPKAKQLRSAKLKQKRQRLVTPKRTTGRIKR